MKVVAFADQLDYDNSGDFVKCMYCEKKMLIGKGRERCPECGTVGMLDWIDNEHQECSIEEIEKMGYEVVVK